MWCYTCGPWPTNHHIKQRHHHHFSADMAEIELPFQARCLSSRDRDPERELEDGWSVGGDGTAAGGRRKPECPVVRQVAER